MNYKKLFYLFIFLLFSCVQYENKPKIDLTIFDKSFTNKGFTLLYDEKFKKQKIIKNSIDERSLIIFQRNLKKDTPVKITNLLNNRSLIAKVGKKSKYPNFYNSVISKRIFEELKIDLNEPYIEIIQIDNDSLFVANKAKTFDEEKQVANKAPVEGIKIDTIGDSQNEIIKKKEIKSDFKYIIKIADFYYLETANILKQRIYDELNNKNAKIEKISKNKYRVFIGPYKDLDSLKKSYNDIDKLSFENIEILKL